MEWILLCGWKMRELGIKRREGNEENGKEEEGKWTGGGSEGKRGKLLIGSCLQF